MSSSEEIEIKFVVYDLEQLIQSLKNSGFKIKTERTHEMNTLYDTPARSIRRKGELVRIRKYGATWTLTHKAKGTTGRHKSRQETETRIEDGQKLARIFESVGLEPTFRYEKFRTEWTDGRGDVVVDETPIGTLSEIEGTPEWIDATAQKLGIQEKDYIVSSYAELFQQWKKKIGSAAEEMTFAAVASPF